MPTLLTPPPEIAPLTPRRKLWTREECETMAKAGLLDWAHHELIEGDLISTMGKNRPHVRTIRTLLAILSEIFGTSRVDFEAPVEVATADARSNEPEPDLMVLQKDSKSYNSTPMATDVLLLAEIADSTLTFDLSVKARLYARAEIPEYWVVDVQSRKVFVHRDPVAGSYASIVSFSDTESISPLAAPDHAISVAKVFE